MIALGLTLGLSNCKKPQEKDSGKNLLQRNNISGKIVDIDEDSFGIAHHGGSNFEFEHMRIKALDGKIYKLIFPGPSNYIVGDEVNFQYYQTPRVSYKELCRYGREKTSLIIPVPMQKGYFDIDGVIVR